MEMIRSRTITRIWFDECINMTADKKIVWIPAAGRNTLAARVESAPAAFQWLVGITEHDIDPIQQWCEEHNCGTRISFDQFRFRNKREMTMFLLRWA